jgi:hypothetical protein
LHLSPAPGISLAEHYLVWKSQLPLNGPVPAGKDFMPYLLGVTIVPAILHRRLHVVMLGVVRGERFPIYNFPCWAFRVFKMWVRHSSRPSVRH